VATEAVPQPAVQLKARGLRVDSADLWHLAAKVYRAPQMPKEMSLSGNEMECAGNAQDSVSSKEPTCE